MYRVVWRLNLACLGIILWQGTGQAETLTNIAIQNHSLSDVRILWSNSTPQAVYTVQWSDVLPATRWRALRPWNQWPLATDEHVLAVETNSVRFFRVEAIQRGRVLAQAFQQNYSLFQIQLILAFSGFDLGVEPTYDVDVHRIDYETLDPWLGGGRASGILIVPRGVSGAVPLLSYQHGTLFARTEAPTDPGSFERLVGVVAASTGFAVAMADYLGLGSGSTGLHPYVQSRAGATVVTDMIRAARTVASGLSGVTLNDKLFLAGYSQGGQVTLAAQREIEERENFTIIASAPMEGPYDLSETMFDVMLAEQPYTNPEFFPYVLFSYNLIYRLFDDPADVFLEPYATSLPPLFDGTHSGEDIADAMPPSGIPSDILKPELRAALRTDPNHPWRVALRENDLLGWRPHSPTRLVHCGSDATVPLANATKAYDSFVAAGATQVELVNPDDEGDHETCLEPAARNVLAWFVSLR